MVKNYFDLITLFDFFSFTSIQPLEIPHSSTAGLITKALYVLGELRDLPIIITNTSLLHFCIKQPLSGDLYVEIEIDLR